MKRGQMRVWQILKARRAREKVKRQLLDSVTAACFLGSGMIMHACTRAWENVIENATMTFTLFLLLHLSMTITLHSTSCLSCSSSSSSMMA